jgi:hypothetical protein
MDSDMTKEEAENKANASRPKNTPKLSVHGSLCESAEGDRMAGLINCVCETVSECIYS